MDLPFIWTVVAFSSMSSWLVEINPSCRSGDTNALICLPLSTKVPSVSIGVPLSPLAYSSFIGLHSCVTFDNPAVDGTVVCAAPLSISKTVFVFDTRFGSSFPKSSW